MRDEEVHFLHHTLEVRERILVQAVGVVCRDWPREDQQTHRRRTDCEPHDLSSGSILSHTSSHDLQYAAGICWIRKSRPRLDAAVSSWRWARWPRRVVQRLPPPLSPYQ